ncbi:molybdopterin-dependent oxidoreductase [Microbacterium sp. CFH 90308]|uniref:Molybdopterin-dependent oxidoreductase n=1 Tax=Microbacterium salsuginis TaxID=2722803 RepID=A0ABX1KBG0_9MICO|nr:molybdopterin-dependent oxidoreductase [Microbacterium sp. CFH 90308]NLP83710.1 molybdopterin-dependent oxidoreductase [Microbacterium sp. CFH 90308]
MRTRMAGARFWLLAAGAGVVSAAVLLATAELVALVTAREVSPLLAVGSFVIDIVPQPLKELAISTFGEYDKIALLAGLCLAVVVASSIAGLVELARPLWGVALLTVGAALATAAILTRAGATTFAFLPPLAGAAAGGAVLWLLTRRLRAWRDAASAPSPESDAATGSAVAPNRRAFLTLALISAAAAVVVGVGARAVSVATSSIAGIRDALRLPAPRSKVSIPAGAELDVPGLSPLITPNSDFYRVDTALTVPSIDPQSWRLTIDGMVEQPLELTFQELLDRGLDEYAITLTCVSNEVGGGLVGNAIWTGVPVRDLLRLAKPTGGADMVLSRSVDGFTAGTPLETLTDDDRDAILAVTMNGEPLPFEHGFPVRMVVPGLYGYVSATKWLTQLTVTTFEKDEAYWTPRGYSAKAPIKMSSRIDTPRAGTPIDAGAIAIAGMAWAQTIGIERVEVSIDDGDWQPAELSAPLNDDTWVQWRLAWEATPGTHYITARAVDNDGTVQIQERAPIAPDGSTGWQRLLITVR